MKANPKRKTKCAALQAPPSFEVPNAAQWYGADVVSAITKLRQEHAGTDEAIIQENLDALLQEAEEGNELAVEILIYLSQGLQETVRILDSKMDGEIKTRVLHAHSCATKAFLDSLELD